MIYILFVRLRPRRATTLPHTLSPSPRLCQSDTGPGLDAAQRARLFVRFEQSDARTTAQHGGFGLGLAISRELVLAMGGRIGVHAAAGGGARFVVDLPLAAVQPRADNSCTASTSAATCAGSMSGDMPWPRLNPCPSDRTSAV